MGYFTPAQRWGFPHKMQEVVRSFESGLATLSEALEKLGASYPATAKTMYTYVDGQKKAVNCIEFGCPVVARFVFN